MLTKSQVKYIQSLNEKKFRQQEDLFVAEGPKIINELLACPNVEPVAIYANAVWWAENTRLRDSTPFVAFHELQTADLERISSLSTPNQVVGLFRQPIFTIGLAIAGRVSLLLDGIQDPGNMGTIIRIADWFGVGHIIASPDSVDVFNSKVIQSTMGSIARVRVIYEEISSFIKQQETLPVYAAVLRGESLAAAGKITEGLLLVGNESKGIREELLKLARYQVTIPRYGRAESLNAAVATGIILSHIL